MSTTAEQPRFKIQGREYPWVMLDDWTFDDYLICRQLGGVGERELLTHQVDPVVANGIFAAIAFAHGNPQVGTDDILRVFRVLNPRRDIELVGFDAVLEDGRPPAVAEETQEPGSSESSTASSDATQETSDGTDSGIPPSDGDAVSDLETSTTLEPVTG